MCFSTTAAVNTRLFDGCLSDALAAATFVKNPEHHTLERLRGASHTPSHDVYASRRTVSTAESKSTDGASLPGSLKCWKNFAMIAKLESRVELRTPYYQMQIAFTLSSAQQTRPRIIRTQHPKLKKCPDIHPQIVSTVRLHFKWNPTDSRTRQ